MKWLHRIAVLPRALFCAVLLAAAAAHAANEPVTEPEKCLFLGVPHRFAYLQENNLLLMFNGGGAYALDAASGNEIWHRYVESARGYHGVFFGKRKVLGWSNQGVFLLDPATGHETWARNDYRSGPLLSAYLSPGETQVLAVCERGCILYTMAGHSRKDLPQNGATRFYSWLPGGDKLLFEQLEEVADKTTQKFIVVDAGTGAVTPGWEQEYSQEAYLAVSTLGEFAAAIPENEDATTLKILDACTGKTSREFKGLPGKTKYFFWCGDATSLFYVDATRRRATVVDGTTGQPLFSLTGEGHRFLTNPPYDDASGNAWIFSMDDANNRYAWPLTPGGTPQKVLNGDRIGFGNLQISPSSLSYVLTECRLEDELWASAAYTLEDMRKIAEWRCRLPQNVRWADCILNKDKTHTVKFYLRDGKEQDWPKDIAFGVYRQDSENPIRTGEGRPLALSPDAHYMMVQTGDDSCSLYDVEADKTVQRISVPIPDDYRHANYFWITAAFSDNCERVAVNTTFSIEVIELAGDCPKWSMTGEKDPTHCSAQPSFSPDGMRILCGGRISARLFDANSGELLHTFAETERFADLYRYTDGFWSSLARSAEDWIGTVTDKFKQGVFVEAAFAENGAKIVTHAAGQVIRIWDAESGKLLHTIHTGLPEKRNKEGEIRNNIILSPANRYAYSYNGNNYGIASLWSLADGMRQRQYQLPAREYSWPQAAPTDDGKAVYIECSENLYRWPGVPEPEKSE